MDQLKFSAEIINMIQSNFLIQIENQKQQQFKEGYEPVKSIQIVQDIKKQIAFQIEQAAIMLKSMEEIQQNEELIKLKLSEQFKLDFEKEFDLEFKLTPLAYDLQIANYNDICQKNFGEQYRIAEWNDLVDVLSEMEESQIDSFIQYLGFTQNQNDFAIQVNGSHKYSSSRYYFVSWHNHKKPDCFLAHDQINNHLLSLGSWVGSRRILCVKNKQINHIESLYDSSCILKETFFEN